MIETIADLLMAFKTKEVEAIKTLGIRHRPTIGNTYEGLTEKILNAALFKNLNLTVVSNSFIKHKDGTRSDEMDIMLIEGEGEKIPYTKGQYDVSYESVVAIIQVKKSLNKSQIDSAYSNLKNASDQSRTNVLRSFSRQLLRDTYRGICKEDMIVLGKERKHFTSSTKEFVYHILKVESDIPPRIVFAYDGYKSEYGLREGFKNFLLENKSEVDDMKYGFGPLNFPSLIINGNYSLIKGNCRPYGSPLINDQWPLFLSSSESPMIKFLEIIWTQLAYRYSLPSSIFGDDLELEGLNMFLNANVVNVGGRQGWNYEYFSLKKRKLEESRGVEKWTPVRLTDEEHDTLSFLCKNVEVNTLELARHLDKSVTGVEIGNLIDSLRESGFVYHENGRVGLLTEKCRTTYVPGFGYCAGDDKTGRFTKWVSNYMIENRKNQSSS